MCLPLIGQDRARRPKAAGSGDVHTQQTMSCFADARLKQLACAFNLGQPAQRQHQDCVLRATVPCRLAEPVARQSSWRLIIYEEGAESGSPSHRRSASHTTDSAPADRPLLDPPPPPIYIRARRLTSRSSQSGLARRRRRAHIRPSVNRAGRGCISKQQRPMPMQR